MRWIIFSFLLICASCSKNDDENVVQAKIELNVQCKHHSWNVAAIDVYLKKNATQWPGQDISQYDLHKQTDIDGMATFSNLGPGNYYVYATGYDVIWGDTVIGYDDVLLDNNTVEGNKKNVTLFVSE